MLKTLSFDNPDFMPRVEMALLEDPLYTLLCESEAQRKKLINIFSSRILTHQKGKLSGFYIGDNIDAAAIWSDLRSKGNHSWYKALVIQFRMLISGSIAEIGKIQKPLQQMEKAIASVQTGCDNYLELLMVDKSKRGQGLSSKLVYPQLELFDQGQRVCGLDTFNPENLAIYHKFGFELVNQIEFGEGVTNYQMIRQPRN